MKNGTRAMTANQKEGPLIEEDFETKVGTFEA